MPIANEVAIVGVGTTKFGEHFDVGFNDLLIDACTDAFADAGVEPKQIEAGWLGTYMPYAWGFEGNSGATVAEALNLYPIPVTRVANYCVTGMEAVRGAAMAVAAGEVEIALAVGVEKMREVPSRGSLVAQHVEKGHPMYCKGRTAPGMFALLATRYLHEHHLDDGILAKVAVKNHANGVRNPKAHFRKAVTEEAARKAAFVADPLRMFDCCPTTDGAAAAIVTTVKRAREMGRPYAVIRGVGLAITNGYFTTQMDPRFDFLGFEATRRAAAEAYRQAGIANPFKDIDVAECHDCFTITEILNYEDLGFCKKGEGHELIASGVTAMGGDLPVNTSGGLKSCGHPVGASGVRMINNIVDQVLGRAGDMQVPGASLGIAHTLGGPGAVSCVFVVGTG